MPQHHHHPMPVSPYGSSPYGPSPYLPHQGNQMGRATYQLSLSARGLKDKDAFSKSDPYCVLYQKGMGHGGWMRVGKTETIKNNLNPSWFQRFTVEHAGSPVFLKFEVWDEDSGRDDHLGRAEVALDRIVSSPGMRHEVQLRSGWSGGGTLLVVARRADGAGGAQYNPYGTHRGGRFH